MAYKTVDEKFWTDPKIKQIKPRDRYLMLYLITNPHAHYCGLYYLPMALIIEETGLDKKTVEAGLKLFIDFEFIAYDYECSIVFILNMFRYQNSQGGNPARIKQGIESQLKTIHSYELINIFIDKYQGLNITLPQGLGKVTLTLPQPSVTDTDTDSFKGKRIVKEKTKETPFLEGFAISDRVRIWSQGKYVIDDYLEPFYIWARSKDRKYKSWDDTFMRFVREDWGRVRDIRVNPNFKEQWEIEEEKRLEALENEKPETAL